VTTLDEIARRDAEEPQGLPPWEFERWATMAVADRRVLLGLVREAREALTKLHEAAAAIEEWPGLGHRDCTAETCYAVRALTEGSDRT
jgi:hypothetical protein